MFHVKQVEYKVEAPCGLLEFLMQKMPDSSRSKVKEILAHNVFVDGRRNSQFNFQLQPGMCVSIEKVGYRERYKPRELDIMYEDAHLLVVNKHEGLLSYSKNTSDVTVISVLNKYLYLTHQHCNAHIVHRLDRDTSGLMVVSKSKQVSQQFEADYCVLSSPTDNGGKLAVTHYKVVKRSRRYTLLELRLDTGRRNQIRVHLREEKHPVVHDPMYGYKDDISPINRLALHAFRLCFVHPVTGKKMEFKTPYPPSFLKLMEL